MSRETWVLHPGPICRERDVADTVSMLESAIRVGNTITDGRRSGAIVPGSLSITDELAVLVEVDVEEVVP
jgi:hypothetical protein